MSFVQQATRWPFKVISYAFRKVVQLIYVRNVFQNIGRGAAILEIGGGYNPKFRRATFPNVKHLDHLSREGLIEKYGRDPHAGHLVGNIEHIDYVCSGDNLHACIGDDRFDLVYSCHALEHQVNLIKHFASISLILNETGYVLLEIPYISACFDLFRYPTTVGDVLCQHLAGHRFHTGKQIFDSVAQTVNFNDGRVPNVLEMRYVRFVNDIELAYKKAIVSFERDTPYQDSHAWTFTPTSFELLMVELALLDLTDLEVEYVTPPYGNTFLVKMVRSAHRSRNKEMLSQQRLKLSKKLYRRH